MLPIIETALHFILNKYEKLHIMQYHILTTKKKPIRYYVEKNPCENVTACIDLLEFSINWSCQLAFFILCLCISSVWWQLLTNFYMWLRHTLHVITYSKGNYSNWEMFCTILRLCQYSFKKTVHVRLPCWCYRLTFHDAFLICWRHIRDVSYSII